jgi:hypothetical protein
MPSRGAPLTVAQILAWADAHRERTGQWPSAKSGAVADAAGQTWAGANAALRQGLRGLTGGDSLARLLRRERGAAERRGRTRGAARRHQAVALRAAGLSLADVGRRLGVTRQAISHMLRKARAGCGERADWTAGQ